MAAPKTGAELRSRTESDPVREEDLLDTDDESKEAEEEKESKDDK
jgi:hypothetical protein